MKDLKFNCPECNQVLSVPPALKPGAQVKCPHCEKLLTLPAPSQKSAPTEPQVPPPEDTASSVPPAPPALDTTPPTLEPPAKKPRFKLRSMGASEGGEPPPPSVPNTGEKRTAPPTAAEISAAAARTEAEEPQGASASGSAPAQQSPVEPMAGTPAQKPTEIAFNCQHCDEALVATFPDKPGDKLDCPACDKPIVIPGASTR